MLGAWQALRLGRPCSGLVPATCDYENLRQVEESLRVLVDRVGALCQGNAFACESLAKLDVAAEDDFSDVAEAVGAADGGALARPTASGPVVEIEADDDVIDDAVPTKMHGESTAVVDTYRGVR